MKGQCFNIIYKCTQCRKTEERSIGNWKIECSCSGTFINDLKGDFCICDRCGCQYNGHINQCTNCKNTFLTYAYTDEPTTNQAIIKTIKENFIAENKTLFNCPLCHTEQSFYINNPSAPFCDHCGELLVRQEIDLKKIRLSKHWSQKLMAKELGISLRTYIALDLKQKKPSAKIMLKCAKIGGTKG